jgi:hypothetical protein
MSVHPTTPQAPRFDGIAAELRAMAATHAASDGVVAALHALILAALARLFARLDDMFAQWQAGLLLPPPSRVRAPRPAAPRANRTSRTPYARPTSVAPHAPEPPAAITPARARRGPHRVPSRAIPTPHPVAPISRPRPPTGARHRCPRP